MNKNFTTSTVALVGIPYDKKSSFLQGAAFAPAQIRQTLHGGAGNYWTENFFNPIENEHFHDQGDLVIEDYFDIEKKVANILSKGFRILALGGDHSITYPILKAHRPFYEDLHILHIDAHGDLYDKFEGDPYSHACPFARIMEEGLCSHLVQVGIRSLNPHQRKQGKMFGVETIEMKSLEEKLPSLQFEKPLYISLDLDGLDPAFAPGVAHPEPGGLSTRQVLSLIQRIQAPIVGADIVELIPHRDVAGITAALATKLLKEIAGKMFENPLP